MVESTDCKSGLSLYLSLGKTYCLLLLHCFDGEPCRVCVCVGRERTLNSPTFLRGGRVSLSYVPIQSSPPHPKGTVLTRSHTNDPPPRPPFPPLTESLLSKSPRRGGNGSSAACQRKLEGVAASSPSSGVCQERREEKGYVLFPQRWKPGEGGALPPVCAT